MIRVGLCVVAIGLTFAGEAEAKCGTSQLDGNWFMGVSGKGVVKVRISGGTVTMVPAGKFSISQGVSCKVTVVYGGTTLIGSSESIPKSSTLKPRTIVAVSPTSNLTLVRY